jgi:hypothetical protein
MSSSIASSRSCQQSEINVAVQSLYLSRLMIERCVLLSSHLADAAVQQASDMANMIENQAKALESQNHHDVVSHELPYGADS